MNERVYNQRCPSGVLWAVAGVAMAMGAASLAGQRLWVSPDATYYVKLAGGIADHGDFSNELFLIRPVGYPLLLAGMFRLFGEHSPTAIQVVQHAMLVLIAILAAMTAWHLSHRRSIAVLSGLMCALSFQLLTFTNLIIAEIPYALALIATIYALVRFHRTGNLRCLIVASMLAGLSSLFRPTGLALIPICLLVAWQRAWRTRPTEVIKPSRWRGLIRASALACLPAFVVLAPTTIYNRLVHGADVTSRCRNLALYHRIFKMDGFDSQHSKALSEIKRVVVEARRAGQLPASDRDYRYWGTVVTAYENVRGLPLGASSAVMGEAARDALREHRRAFFVNTLRYAYWMTLSMDTFYRFHPGGAPGWVKPGGECVRDPTAVIYDIATYQPMLASWIAPYQHYLPLTNEPRPLTPYWRDLAGWFHRSIETGPSIAGVGSTPYEAFTWLCLIGTAASLLTRDRQAWLIVMMVIATQIAGSALFAGPSPRYVVPVRPLLLMGGALAMVLVAQAFVGLLGWARAEIRQKAGGKRHLTTH